MHVIYAYIIHAYFYSFIRVSTYICCYMFYVLIILFLNWYSFVRVILKSSTFSWNERHLNQHKIYRSRFVILFDKMVCCLWWSLMEWGWGVTSHMEEQTTDNALYWTNHVIGFFLFCWEVGDKRNKIECRVCQRRNEIGDVTISPRNHNHTEKISISCVNWVWMWNVRTLQRHQIYLIRGYFQTKLDEWSKKRT